MCEHTAGTHRQRTSGEQGRQARTCVQIALMSSCGVCVALRLFPDLLQRIRLTVSVAPPAAVHRLVPAGSREGVVVVSLLARVPDARGMLTGACGPRLLKGCDAVHTHHPTPRRLARGPLCGWVLSGGSWPPRGSCRLESCLPQTPRAPLPPPALLLVL